MERLGDKLKQVEAGITADDAARTEAEKATAAVAERLRYEAVRDQFETWKRDIAAAIARDELPPTLRVATAPPGKTGATAG